MMACVPPQVHYPTFTLLVGLHLVVSCWTGLGYCVLKREGCLLRWLGGVESCLLGLQLPSGLEAAGLSKWVMHNPSLYCLLCTV